jgi:hypothetical protein
MVSPDSRAESCPPSGRNSTYRPVQKSGTTSYIVPVDAPSPKVDADFREKAISLRRFGEYMREANSRHVLAIFDSCFGGTVFNVARSLPPPAITLATTEPVREFISSGEADQTVSDDGTFRKLFLDVLAGNEPDADANHDGYVTGTELGLFLHQKMTNLTYNRQTPRYGKLNAYGYDRGDFVFQVGKPDIPSTPAATQSASEAERVSVATQGATSQANVSRADELYLRCELRNWCCNPITYHVDFEHSTVAIDGGDETRHNARITHDQIVVPFPSYGPTSGHFINRMTGDVEFVAGSGMCQGTCAKIEKPKF